MASASDYGVAPQVNMGNFSTQPQDMAGMNPDEMRGFILQQ